jgi:hypothetical protein
MDISLGKPSAVSAEYLKRGFVISLIAYLNIQIMDHIILLFNKKAPGQAAFSLHVPDAFCVLIMD